MREKINKARLVLLRKHMYWIRDTHLVVFSRHSTEDGIKYFGKAWYISSIVQGYIPQHYDTCGSHEDWVKWLRAHHVGGYISYASREEALAVYDAACAKAYF